MKKSLFKAFLIIICISLIKLSNAQPLHKFPKTSDLEAVITIHGNAYAYPKSGDASQNFINENGITNWNDANTYFKIFFYAAKPGKIQLSLKTKSASGKSSIKVQLDSSGKNYNINIDKTSDYINQTVGSFEIKDSGYHCIQIKAKSKTGNFFPDIESLIVSGSNAQNIQYNTSEYRGAPATHLWYHFPNDSSVAWFYNEITVPIGVNAVNAYYMANGFNDGYMGIQVNSETERRFIFSVWSNYQTDDPKQIPADYAVTLMKKGKDVYADAFGNEGSGGHSHLVINWKNGVTYKFLLGAKAAGDHTIFTGYYFDVESNQWKLIAQWDKSKTNGKLLSGLYSFVENFGPNGNDYFKANYGNQWIRTTSGKWIELTKCYLTTTADKIKHPVFDYGGGVEDNQFYMYTGGFKKKYNLSLHPVFERKPTGKAPDINFATLPDK